MRQRVIEKKGYMAASAIQASNPCQQPLACRSHWRSRPGGTSPLLQKTAHQVMILRCTAQLFHFQTESRARTKGTGVPVDHFAKLDTGNILTAQGDGAEKMTRHKRYPFLQRGCEWRRTSA